MIAGVKRYLWLILTALLVQLAPARAIILYGTGDPSANTTAPTDPDAAGGWDYEGDFGSFLGTPIGSDYFITAAHIGGSVGQTFTYQGADYTTTANYVDPGSDLSIWQVSGTFPSYAPIFTNPGAEVGQPLDVFGRGTQRGAAVYNADSSLAGWQWGTADGVQRWGQNVVSSIQQGYLVANFEANSGPNGNPLANEASLSAGDSGGGVFVKQNGVWSLAGINYGVTSPYSYSKDGSNGFDADIFNAGTGLYTDVSDTSTPDYEDNSGPGYWVATEIAGRLSFVDGVLGIPEPSSVAVCALGVAGMLVYWARSRRRRL
jgi:hypothetical protein